MASTSATPRPSPSGIRVRRPALTVRRFGYVLAIGINVLLLYLITVDPGWEEMSFLTGATAQVIGLVNVSLVVGIVVNTILVATDPPRVKALGDLVTTGVGLAVVLRVRDVFPFDFSTWSRDWSTALRVLLVLALIGMVAGILEALVRLVRGTAG